MLYLAAIAATPVSGLLAPQSTGETIEHAILVGVLLVLLVLLTPCIDYGIVFTGVAGGSAQRLVAAAPLLMLLQLLLLPVYLYLFVGPGLADIVDPEPFVRAFVVLIAVPLTLAGSLKDSPAGSLLPAR